VRILVCGSRTFEDAQFIWDVFRSQKDSDTVIIEGGACGADNHAQRWAKANKIPFEQYDADWGRYGRGAGPIRNKVMLDEGKPDLVLAFVDKPLDKSRGTADMVKQARAAGVKTYVIECL
jgi:hypothetical protein